MALVGKWRITSMDLWDADALDLDGKALVEEYRLQHEHPSEAMLEPIVSTPQSRRRPPARAGPSSRMLATATASDSRGDCAAVSRLRRVRIR